MLSLCHVWRSRCLSMLAQRENPICLAFQYREGWGARMLPAGRASPIAVLEAVEAEAVAEAAAAGPPAADGVAVDLGLGAARGERVSLDEGTDR